MTTVNDLLNRLQIFQQGSKIYTEIFSATATNFIEREEIVEEIVQNLNPSTANWGLKIFENQLGIVTDEAKPISERREFVLSKMRGIGTVNAQMIRNVSSAFQNGNVDIEHSNGLVTIKFVDILGQPANVTDFKKTLRDIIPAHLDITYVFLYNTYFKLQTYTHAQLSTMTHEQLRSSVLS